jgi:hypothetical protein
LTNLRNNFDAQYLKYCLLSHEAQEAMKKFGSGAAQDKLGIYKIKEIQIPNPPAEIQRKIAAILSAYDDLIENNTRRIEILEEMARSLYREWFVNFRFPGHEQVKMVDSELGPRSFLHVEVNVTRDSRLQNGHQIVAQNRRLAQLTFYGTPCRTNASHICQNALLTDGEMQRICSSLIYATAVNSSETQSLLHQQ